MTIRLYRQCALARITFLLLALLMAAPVHAVQPDEMLDDPVLEQRARQISKEVRCLVCRNESIDDSNADLARDLRLLVRERLVAGDTDQGVRDYLVARYGEYVLLQPSFSAANLMLWLAGPVLFIIGLAGALIYLRRQGGRTEALSEEEQARLDDILRK